MISGHQASMLRQFGLRPTRQRMLLAELLFSSPHRHITAESLMDEVTQKGHTMSLSTIYNTLHQFTRSGLLSEIKNGGDVVWFDTNTEKHHHFYDVAADHLIDIPTADIKIAGIPDAPEGKMIDGVEVVVLLVDRE